MSLVLGSEKIESIADSIARKFLFSYHDEEIKIVDCVLQELSMKKNNPFAALLERCNVLFKHKDKDQEKIKIFTAIKSLYLFWIDYSLFQHCSDDSSSLRLLREALNRQCLNYCENNSNFGVFFNKMTSQYALYHEHFQQANGEDTFLESTAFCYVLRNDGIVIDRDPFFQINLELQLRSLKRIVWDFIRAQVTESV